jgi:hypothetical protein
MFRPWEDRGISCPLCQSVQLVPIGTFFGNLEKKEGSLYETPPDLRLWKTGELEQVHGMRLPPASRSSGDLCQVLLPKAFIPLRGMGHLSLSAYESFAFTATKLKCPPDFVRKAFVRGMRFELTRPFERYHLKVVRLPISPPTHRLPKF